MNKNQILTRTFAIFRGDIYGGTQTIGQSLGSNPLSVAAETQKDNSSTSILNSGTYSYGVSAVNTQGEYTPVYATTSQVFYNSKILNFVSWTSPTTVNYLFFHVYKTNFQNNGFNNSRITSPFEITDFTLSDTVSGLDNTSESIGVGSFAFPIKDSDATTGLIGGLKYHPFFNTDVNGNLDNAPLLGIQSCIIKSGGSKYTQPTVLISGSGYGANISLSTDINGAIVSANVISFGSGYSSMPNLIVNDSFGSTGSGAVLEAVLSDLKVGLYTGNTTNPIGTSIIDFAPIPLVNITSNANTVVSPLVSQPTVGLSSNTNYWAVFKMNTPYTLTTNQQINFANSTGYSGSISTFNGANWINTSSSAKVYKMGFVDYGLSGNFVSSNGVNLTEDVAPIPAQLRLYVPNLDLSSLGFNDIGTQVSSQTGYGTALPIQNSMLVYVKAYNSQTGITSVLQGAINKGTPRNSEVLLGTEEDVFDQVLEVNVQPNFNPIGTSIAFNYLPNTKIIQWTINDLFTVDSKP